MSNYKKPTVLKFLIYFTAGGTKLYLLVKNALENKWSLPEFKLNLELIDVGSYKQSQIDIDTLSQVYPLLEEHFAISRNEVKSVKIQTEKVGSKRTLTPVIDIEVNEEAIIVLSNKYQDYSWGNWEEANSN
jgi:hypothetical protein